ncbi:MAG: A/G-specific adenine glycosylase [Bacteroidales bacterium]
MNFADILRDWYKKNRRSLPWRETRDPYRVWISEVILQQTRVATGLGYYERFTGRFPDPASLARADEDEVLRLWQGLGYYSRARNLHQAAGTIVELHGGAMPRRYEDLLALRGIGEYTAAAVASICFGEARAVVDGNVIRVLSRLYGVEEPVDSATGARRIRELADALLDRRDPGTHNQALMEFGALHCLPSSPLCPSCPFRDVCVAFGSKQTGSLPRKKPKKPLRHRWLHYYVFHREESLLIRKRGNGDIWRSLYEFPLVETDRRSEEEHILGEMLEGILECTFPGHKQATSLRNVRFTVEALGPEIPHVLSHQKLHLRFVRVRLTDWPPALSPACKIISFRERTDHGFPQPINRYLEAGIF